MSTDLIATLKAETGLNFTEGFDNRAALGMTGVSIGRSDDGEWDARAEVQASGHTITVFAEGTNPRDALGNLNEELGAIINEIERITAALDY